jgi:hypothetical protein
MRLTWRRMWCLGLHTCKTSRHIENCQVTCDTILSEVHRPDFNQQQLSMVPEPLAAQHAL